MRAWAMAVVAALVLAAGPALADKGGKGKGGDEAGGKPAAAEAKGKGNGKGKGGNSDKGGRGGRGGGDAGDAALGAVIGAVESQLIRQYFAGGQAPADYRGQALPPGIAKNLARGKPLPPGIAKKGLPPDLQARLPARPDYEWQVVGSDVVLVQAATQIVADILVGALR